MYEASSRNSTSGKASVFKTRPGTIKRIQLDAFGFDAYGNVRPLPNYDTVSKAPLPTDVPSEEQKETFLKYLGTRSRTPVELTRDAFTAPDVPASAPATERSSLPT